MNSLDNPFFLSNSKFQSVINYHNYSHILMESSFYELIMSNVTQYEDEHGDYDFSKISNIGMFYLFIHKRGTNRKDKTKRDYIRELVAYLEYVSSIGKSDIRELSRHDMEIYQAYMEEKYPKSTTRAKKIGIIQSFLEWCYIEEYTPKNLTRGLHPVRINKEEIPERVISEEALKNAISFFNNNPKVKSLLLILGTSGMRLNEVITPKWGALYFDSKQGNYYLRTITKRGKVRHANIKKYALEELFEYRRRLGLTTELNSKDDSPFYPNRLGKHYTLSGLSSTLSKHMEAAGLTTIQNVKVSPHFIRHYFAQTAFANGAPIGFIAETLSHSSERTTKENYLRNNLGKDHDVSKYVDIIL
ncbi:tyrosine-type recombinase/integrase [Paenibacillus vini]|uniref:tyrosine-type recombinase/integrase n=1 Tax=Paenibacillus vini TaxID=1476024 RepID=UPI0025B6FA96|nr:tyrosine-type recombinase/integrase [Paenibacillus vini]MDN4067584.1 tyrosine-type recombinase/integrase [Paenibacillus vini]